MNVLFHSVYGLLRGSPQFILQVDAPTLYRVGHENSSQFKDSFTSFNSVSDFLHDASDYIPVISTNLNPAERESIVAVEYDIDGIVIELNSFTALRLR